MIGLVLAAGQGTRLTPLSKRVPKALIPTLNVPQAGWAIESLFAGGCESVIINAHYHADQIFRFADLAAEITGRQVNVSHETGSPAGTAGALGLVADRLSDPFVIHNADISTDFPLNVLVEAHRSSGAAATVLAIPSEHRADLVVEEGWVVELVDRREGGHPGYIYGGIGVFGSSVVEGIPNGFSGLFESVFVPAVRGSGGMACVVWEGYWRDVANPCAHLSVNIDALSGIRDITAIDRWLPGSWDEDTGSLLGPGVETRDVELRHAVLGRDAKIEPGSSVVRCVVWDGTQVARGSYGDAVLTQLGQVRC